MKKKNSNWNSTESLLKAINAAVEVKRFLGNNGAIAQANRLRAEHFSGELRPALCVVEERKKVYEAATEFFQTKGIGYYVHYTWCESRVKQLVREVEFLKSENRIIEVSPSEECGGGLIFKEL